MVTKSFCNFAQSTVVSSRYEFWTDDIRRLCSLPAQNFDKLIMTTVIKLKHFLRYWPFVREFPALRPVTRSFDVFFDLRPNKRLSKQWWGWWLERWFETPSSPLWRHCNVLRQNGGNAADGILICIFMRNISFFIRISPKPYISTCYTLHCLCLICSKQMENCSDHNVMTPSLSFSACQGRSNCGCPHPSGVCVMGRNGRWVWRVISDREITLRMRNYLQETL